MADRYEMQPDGLDTWQIFDVFTEKPAEMEGRIMTGLNVDEASDNLVVLNRLDREKAASRR